MKIVHILFDRYPYISNFGYQENKLIKYQSEDNDVVVITGKTIPSTLREFVSMSDLKSFEEVHNKSNHIHRTYRLNLLFENTRVADIFYYYKGMKKILIRERPDVIILHDLHALSLISVNKFLKHNNVKCVADVHVNYVNSGRSCASRVLHKSFYRLIIRRNISRISKIFYLNQNSKIFINKMYGISNKNANIKFMPLGGEMIDFSIKQRKKSEFLKKINLNSKTTIFLHSGKFTKLKKTLEVIEQFSLVDSPSSILILIGEPEQNIKKEFYQKIARDKRIIFLGWKPNDVLMKYLEISDVYLQPGSPSVTAHEAMCKGCATVLSSENNFYTSFIDDSCVIYIDCTSDLGNLFTQIRNNKDIIKSFQERGYALASKIFDYGKQSRDLLIK